MPFGFIVLGPLGTGKTTLTAAMDQFYGALEEPRRPILVNLDPGNDSLSVYAPLIDIRSYNTVASVMQAKGLGPNGSLLKILHDLSTIDFEWLSNALQPFLKDDTCFFIFDCPGQSELFTHDPSLKTILEKLVHTFQFRLVTVNLIESGYLRTKPRYLSALLLSLLTMTFIELPHLNVLTKMDQLVDSSHDLELDWPLSYYVEGKAHLMYSDESAVSENKGKAQVDRYSSLTRALYELVDDMSGLVSFLCISVQDSPSLLELSRAIDKANGYIYGALTPANDSIFSLAQSSCHASRPSEYWEDKIQAFKMKREIESDTENAS